MPMVGMSLAKPVVLETIATQTAIELKCGLGYP